MIESKSDLPAAASKERIAERLRATRTALGLRAVDICERTGIGASAYSNWEAGRSRPNIEDMIRLSEALNIPLDWIYRGDPSGLPVRIARDVLKSAS